MKKLESIKSSKFSSFEGVEIKNILGGVTAGTFFIGDTNYSKETASTHDVNTGWRKDSIKKPTVAEGSHPEEEYFNFGVAEEIPNEDLFNI